MSLSLASAAFKHGDRIPVRHTCDAADLSPPLAWSGGPEGTKSYALIADDPDAPMGVFTHWVVVNVPPEVRDLPEGVPRGKPLTVGGVQGTNDFEAVGYGGPCPPPGKPHGYRFRLYALDTLLSLTGGASRNEVLRAIRGHVLAEAELVGTYGR